MSNTPRTLFSHSSVSPRLQQPEEVTTVRGVRQDKYAPRRVRTATPHPVVSKNLARTRHTDTKLSRPQNYFKKRSVRRQTVQISGWGKPELKAELERIAKQEGVSLSQTVVAGLEEWVRQKLHIQHAVLLQPIIETTIHKEMNRLITNLSQYQGRIVFDVGQIRWLFINTLYREVIHPNKTLTKEEFYELLDKSSKETMKNAHRFIPQIHEVVAAMKKWLMREEEDT